MNLNIKNNILDKKLSNQYSYPWNHGYEAKKEINDQQYQ